MPSAHLVEWLNDFVRLEIVLWNRVDARLRQQHQLSLAVFETMYEIERTGSLRVGDLARSLQITVGAASKLVDRVEAAGYIRREADADDRRASRAVLTEHGSAALAEARPTYHTELAAILDPVLNNDEQETLHALVKRLRASFGETV